MLVEDPDGVNLCRCNNCMTILIDHNPQFEAKRYDESCANGELVQLVDLSDDDISHDIHYFWACPNCRTDEYLSDFDELVL